MSVNEKMTAIADAIREYGSLDGSMTLDQMANNIALVSEKAYGDGHMSGISEGEEIGYANGITDGKQAERVAFWDMYLQNGTRTDYTKAFMTFTDELFKPNHDITPTMANQMFASSKVTNLKQLLEDAGIAFDTSQSKYLTQIYAYSTITHSPILDCTFPPNMQSAFADAKSLVYIEKLIVSENTTYPTTFSNTSALVEVRFEGVIASDINLKWSPLSRASIESIVSCLSDTASGKTVSFKKTAVLAAFGTESAWLSYIAVKPNWNFTLA